MVFRKRKDEISKLIATGNLERALKRTIDFIQDFGLGMEDETILLSMNYYDMRANLRKGVLSYEEADLIKSKLAMSMLQLIQKTEDFTSDGILKENYPLHKDLIDKNIPSYEAKLIFIGSGNVGKTSLVNKITKDTFNPNEVKTEGISIIDWLIKGENSIGVHIWDFGGQEILHATHKFFMTKNSVYVVVITPREEDRYGATDLTYWLKLVQSFAPNSPIIVSANKCEIHSHNINRHSYKINFPNILKFIETSCVTGEGINELINNIKSAIEKLPHLNNPIPQSYFSIKNKLLEIKKDYISYSEYMEICQDVEPNFKEESMSALVSLLHDLGIVLNFREEVELEQTQVLNPEWVTHGVYKIINSPLLFKQKGVISIDKLSGLLDEKRYPRDQHLFLVGLMEKFELCYFLPYERRKIFIPNSFSPERPENLIWHFNETLQFQYNYDILPGSVISRLIVKLHNLIVDDKYWRDGMVISKDRMLAFVVVDKVNLTLRISLKGEGKQKEFLSYIRFHLEDIHSSFKALKISRKIPYEEVLIDYEELIICQEEEVEELFVPKLRKRIKVKELLEGVDVNTELEVINIDEDLKEPLSKKTILFFASNPSDTGRLRLGAEVRELSESLLRSKLRDRFDLLQRFATQPKDLRRSILSELPNIVHFSGHGEKDDSFFEGVSSDKTEVGGLVFEDEIGNSKTVNAKALGDLFKLFADKIECVVLNACYSKTQAEEIAKHINYVIGMNYKISARAAISFSTAFYDALGSGSNVEFAFSYAKNAIALDGLNEKDIPQLIKKA